MKTKEELNVRKNEVETLNRKLAGLSDEEVKIVTGGTGSDLPAKDLPEIEYNGMFNGCTGLEPAPELPAQDLQPGACKPDGYK